MISKKYLFILLNINRTNSSTTQNDSKLINKIENLNNYKLIKYGKYIVLLGVVCKLFTFLGIKLILYYWNNYIGLNSRIKSNYLTVPERNILTTNGIFYPGKHYRKKEITKAKIYEKILNLLTKEEQEEFLSLNLYIIIDDPNIIIQKKFLTNKEKKNIFKKNNKFLKLKKPIICFFLNKKNLSFNLQEKLKTILKHNENYLYNFYELKVNQPIYEIEVENNLARIYQNNIPEKKINSNFYSDLKCPIVATEHGLIHYYYKLKKNNYNKLIRNLYVNLYLLSEFLDEFYNVELREFLNKLISEDFTTLLQLESKILEEKLLESFNKKNKIINLNIPENITDDNINELIQLVFDKITSIVEKYNKDEVNLLKHISTAFFLIYTWTIFNYYLYKNNLPLLPNIIINGPYITPRFWCTLNPLNNTINLKWLGGHFNFSYFTTNEKESDEFKKFIEEWVEKYYKKNNLYNWNKYTHFKVVKYEY